MAPSTTRAKILQTPDDYLRQRSHPKEVCPFVGFQLTSEIRWLPVYVPYHHMLQVPKQSLYLDDCISRTA